MKMIFAAAIAMSLLSAGLADAAPHHHKVCFMRHHHRVCRWR